MLLDLDKDYLKDMDITLMGDIINILKHARVVANKNTSEMVLSDKGIKIFLNEGGGGGEGSNTPVLYFQKKTDKLIFRICTFFMRILLFTKVTINSS